MCGYPIRRDPAGVRDERRPVSDQETERVPIVRTGQRGHDAPPTERIIPAGRPPRERSGTPLPIWALALLALALLSVGVWYFVFARGDGDPEAATQVGGSPSATATATSEAPSEPEQVTYEVQAGDTLSSIAERFGTTTEALVQQNEIADPDLIALGQVLVIPPETGTVTPQVSGSPGTGG
jgi:nucleoid-associated protein YgaU